MSSNQDTQGTKVSSKSTIIDIILATMPNIVFSVLFPFCGASLGFLDKTGKITTLGWFVCIIYIFITVILIVSYNFFIHKSDSIISKDELNNLKNSAKVFKANYGIVKNVVERSDKICDSKLNTLKNEIKKHIDNNSLPFPIIISNPQKQLIEILNGMFDCISDIIDINKSALIFDVAININEQGWKWLEVFESNEGIPIEDINVEGSMFYKLITKNKDYKGFLFYNKKSDHLGEDYKKLQIDIDEDGHFIDGSIMAKHIFVGTSYKDRWIELAIFISSKNDFFVKGSNSVSTCRKNLRDSVFSHFDKRLKIELSLLLLESFNKNTEVSKALVDLQESIT